MAIRSLQVLFLGTPFKADKGMITFLVDSGKFIDLPFFSYLIKADEGNILIDAGIHPEDISILAGQKIDLPSDYYLPKQLQKAGMAMNDINIVILTHMHPDHIGWLNSLPNAEVFVQKEEYKYTMHAHTIDPFLHTPVNDFPTRYHFHEMKWNLIDGDQVIIPGLSVIFTPGHSAGHQSIMVDLPEAGSIIIAGDAAELKENLDKEIISEPRFDSRSAFLSIKRLKLWASVRKSQIFPGHDFAYWEQKIKKLPESYF
jgi:glyoxylase-like metal-dependent hydrolase (beta-lactamase superfamily II)